MGKQHQTRSSPKDRPTSTTSKLGLSEKLLVKKALMWCKLNDKLDASPEASIKHNLHIVIQKLSEYNVKFAKYENSNHSYKDPIYKELRKMLEYSLKSIRSSQEEEYEDQLHQTPEGNPTPTFQFDTSPETAVQQYSADALEEEDTEEFEEAAPNQNQALG